MDDEDTIPGDPDEDETPIKPEDKTTDTDDDELRDVGEGT